MHYSYNHKLEKVKVVMNTKHKLAGFMTLNKAYTDNMLTNNYLTQIKEHIDWLEYDNNIKWMTIRSKDMEVFSKGFDVTTMLYNIRYGNKENVIEYQKNIQELAVVLSSINKPCISQLKGQLSNIAGALFTSLPFVTTEKCATIRFNESAKGITLMAGASYTLSRMPYEIGVYLALSGKTLSQADLYSLNIATEKITIDEEFVDFVQDTMEQKNVFFDINHITDNKEHRGSNLAPYTKDYLEYDLEEELQQRVKDDENPRKVLTELTMEKQMKTYANYKEKYLNAPNANNYISDKTGNLSSQNQMAQVENRCGYFKSIVLDIAELEHERDFESLQGIEGEIYSNRTKILELFRGETQDDIMENLRNDKSAFAKNLLEELSLSSRRVLELNQELVRRAKDLDYVSCLKNEFNVFARRIEDNDLIKQSHNPIYRDTNSKIADIEEYFKEFEENLIFCEVPIHAPVPVKHFYQKYPDSVRYFLSERPNYDALILRNSYQTLVSFMRLRGIDLQNATFTRDKVRESLYKDFKQKDLKLEQEKRVTELIGDMSLSELYFNERMAAIAKQFGPENSNQTRSLIRNLITKYFENDFMGQAEKIDEVLKPTAKFIKKNHVRSMKHFQIESRFANPVLKDKRKIENSYYSAPMEIVEDVTDQPKELLEKYLISQKVEHLKSTRKLTPEKYDMYLRGELGYKDVYDINLKENAPESINLNVNQMNEGYLEIQQFYKDRVVRYTQREGPFELEENFQKKFIDDLIENFEKFRQISEQARENLEDELKDYFFKYSLKGPDQFDWQVTQTLPRYEDTDLKVFESQADEHFNQKEQPNYLPQISSFDGKLDTHGKTISKEVINTELEHIRSLVDINFDQHYNEKLNANTLRDSKVSNSVHKNTTYLEFFQRNIAYDDYLQDMFGFIFELEDKNPFLDQFRLNCMKLLKDIIKTKSSEILQDEHEVFQVGLPVIVETINSKVENLIKENDSSFMGQIDQFINKNVEYEYFRMISPHICLQFSYNQLRNMETVFAELFKVANNNRDSPNKFRDAINDLLKLDLKTMDEVMAMLKLLDEVSMKCISLMNYAKDKAHFSEDVMLGKYLDKNMGNEYKKFHQKNQTKLLEYLKKLDKSKFESIKEHTRRFGNTKEATQHDKESAMRMTLGNKEEENSVHFRHEYEHYYNRDILKALGSSMVDKVNLSYSWRYMYLDFDVKAKRIIEGEESGFNDALTEALKFNKSINKPFDIYDIRQSGENWIKDSITKYLGVLFGLRKKVEPEMSNMALKNQDVQIDSLLDLKVIEKKLYQMLDKEMTALETQKNLIYRKEEQDYEKEQYALSSVSFYDEIRKQVANEDAWRLYTLHTATITDKYEDMPTTQKKNKKAFQTDIITNKRLLDESFMSKGNTYLDYEKKERIEKEETLAKSAGVMEAMMAEKKKESESDQNPLINQIVFSLADDEATTESNLEKGLQDSINQFKEKSLMYAKNRAESS